MPKNNPNNNSDKARNNNIEKTQRRIEIKKNNAINRAGSIYTERDRRANIKIKKIKREFIGRDPFARQKGRGFIDFSTRFYVNWTPTKLLLVSLFVAIPYIGIILFVFSHGITIVGAILIVVAIMFLGIGWLVRWADKNL